MTPGPPDSPPPPSVVVLGRFQPFHRGHAHMLEFADSWRLNNMPNASLVVAVGSSNRPENLRNPWTYSERSEMIYRWLESSSIRDTPIIVPIPDIDDPPQLGFTCRIIPRKVWGFPVERCIFSEAVRRFGVENHRGPYGEQGEIRRMEGP